MMAAPMHDLNMLAIALAYAARGFWVFPVVAGGKIPAIKGWQNRATRDPILIRLWWIETDPVLGVERIRDFNVGIRTGRFGEDGWFVALDMDVKAGARGRESLERLDMEQGTPSWLDTETVDTPSGGLHYLFLTEEPVATSAGRLGPGLDTRGEGGYILAPGSIVNGRSYRSRGGTLAMAPVWLVEAIGRPPPRTRVEGNVVSILDMQPALDRGETWLRSEDSPSATVGARGSTAYRVAAKLKDFGISELAALEMMAEHWNDARCSPPMEFEDLSASVSHAYQYGTRPVGADNPTADFGPVEDEPELDIPVQGTPPPIAINATPFVWRDPSKIPPRRWLYGKHYARQYVSVTIAPGAVGKSSLTIVEALAMATGRALLGIVPVERCRVWIWNGEDPLVEIERRVHAACLLFGIEKAEIEGWLFMDSGRTTEIVIAQATREGTKIAAPVIDAVVATIQANQIDVMIVDPLISAHEVSENDNSALGAVAKAWAKIADLTNISVELVQHSRKTNGAEVTTEDSRGASALVFASRSARALNRMTKEEAERARISNPKSFFRVDNGKANLAPSSEKADWYELVSQPLRNGEGGLDEGDEIAVVQTWAWEDPAELVTEAEREAVLNRIRSKAWREDPRSPDWVGLAVADVLEIDPADAAGKARIREILKAWTGPTKPLRVVEGLDSKRNIRRFVGVYVSKSETQNNASVD